MTFSPVFYSINVSHLTVKPNLEFSLPFSVHLVFKCENLKIFVFFLLKFLHNPPNSQLTEGRRPCLLYELPDLQF
jgi:hypothetical protein